VPLDSFRNGYRENLVRGNDYFENVIEEDIRNSELVSKIPKGIDSIIHLAAITSLPECESLPLESVSINVLGTANILELARKIECEHVIFSSTSAIYENNQEEIFTEDLQTNPHLWYSLSKKLSEEICHSYEKKYGLNVTIARLFNVFGPRQDIHRPNPPLINYIVREVATGRIPTLHGDGNQSRDYIHVDDVVNFISKALTVKPNGIFNVCSGELRSVNYIYKLITDALDSNIIPKFREASKLWNTYPELFEGKFPLNVNLVSREVNKYSLGSNAKAFNVLGWIPRGNIDQEITKTALEIRDSLSN
jgi:nucleoside-diphosphate-sugar epimerase